MAIRRVLRMGEPLLYQKAAAVTVTEFNTPELDALIADMFDTMAALNASESGSARRFLEFRRHV